MTGYESKRAAARDKLEDDDTQVYQNHPAQEPVAWCSQCGHKCPLPAQEPVATLFGTLPVYETALPQRPWVGLTDEDCKGMSAGDRVVAMWADKTLKEKNS